MDRKKVKVAVGMSGGVDSSVAAKLLKDDGYDVVGVYIEAWNEPGCRTDEDREDALRVALELGIMFKVVDVKSEYKERVVEYFYNTYSMGLTPNPDVLCNSEIKFGVFYDWAMKQGLDYVATGHYAKMVERDNQRFIAAPRDISKDQSYFLYRISKEKLDRIIFPLGEYKKSEVRQMASGIDRQVSDKPDSMGVCFIGDVDVKELLKKRLGNRKGDVVYKGQKVGSHNGLWFHTVGQRGGFEIDKRRLQEMGEKPQEMKPLYVVGKDIKSNTLVVGPREQCYIREFRTYDNHFLVEDPYNNERVMVRVRNLGKMYECNIEKLGEWVVVKCDDPIFAVAAGQSAVFYRQMGKELIVMGGGIIE